MCWHETTDKFGTTSLKAVIKISDEKAQIFVSATTFPRDPAPRVGDLPIATQERAAFLRGALPSSSPKGARSSAAPQRQTPTAFHHETLLEPYSRTGKKEQDTSRLVPEGPLHPYKGGLCLIGPWLRET